MNRLNNLYKKMQEILSANPNREPVFEAGILVEHVLGKTRIELGPAYEVDKQDAEKLISLCEKRRTGYPLQYIVGTWQFFDMELVVGEGVLIPRGDTEDVCLAAFEYLKDIPHPNVLDLCSGSGAIALAVKRFFPDANVVAVEKFDRAFSWLKKNIEKTGFVIAAIQEDVFRFDTICEKETFDMIISNPPYIHPNLEGKLQKEVSFEPANALFASEQGLRFYRHISKYYYKALKPGGYLVFEHGFDQAKQVENMILQKNFKIVKRITDTGGNPRGIIARKD